MIPRSCTLYLWPTPFSLLQDVLALAEAAKAASLSRTSWALQLKVPGGTVVPGADTMGAVSASIAGAGNKLASLMGSVLRTSGSNVSMGASGSMSAGGALGASSGSLGPPASRRATMTAAQSLLERRR